MQTIWLEDTIKYDGSQLAPLNNYLKHGVLGDSIVSWAGPCEVTKKHMIDGEDLRAGSEIAGTQMLHFVIELFQLPLSCAVALQRLMGEILILQINSRCPQPFSLTRRGDDVFWGQKKLNISIATCSQTSSLIHYGVNITNKGTPVETCALSDFSIEDYDDFARSFMDGFKEEVVTLKRAMVKVRSF